MEMAVYLALTGLNRHREELVKDRSHGEIPLRPVTATPASA
jgi:hypothetical protein